MASNDLEKETHTRTVPRVLMGALIGAVIGLVAGSAGLFTVTSPAWVLSIDVLMGACAGLFMALVSRW